MSPTDEFPVKYIAVVDIWGKRLREDVSVMYDHRQLMDMMP